MNNPGLATLGEIEASAERTLVVLGTARGGTSAVAGALDRLGVFTGALSAAPVFEDVNLANAIETDGVDAAGNIIQEYNAEHPVWAFKRPRLLYHVQDVHHLFRKPVYIVVFRDVFAAAQRTRISGGVDVFLTMDKLLSDNERIIDFLDGEKPNALLVSYEKLMASPAQLVDRLIELLPGTVEPAARQAAIDFIRPAPEDYLDATRTTKASGAITGISHDRVQGWARYNFPLKPPATLELRINDAPVATAVADLSTDTLAPCPQQPAAQPEGLPCGFCFKLPAGSLSSGDQLSVQATEDFDALEGCPLTVELPADAAGQGHDG
jgi:hypothetical protein